MKGMFTYHYSILRDEIEEIVHTFHLSDNSKGFAFWFLRNQFDMDDQDALESIIDGGGDFGIDAIIYDEKSRAIRLFQFKLPDKVKNIDGTINPVAVLKMIDGFDKLTNNKSIAKGNIGFRKFKEIVKNNDIFEYSFHFCSYNQGLQHDAMVTIIESMENIRKYSGAAVSLINYKVQEISNLVGKLQRQNKISVTLNYLELYDGFNLDQVDLKSYMGVVKAKTLLEAIEPSIDVIFDENIRTFYGLRNNVNKKIYDTSIGPESSFFYFYNNGVAFICNTMGKSVGNSTLTMNSVSIVNGCQTINSLREANIQGKLKDDVFVQIRAFSTNDYELRAKITEYLNVQSPIKPSYFMSNNPVVLKLQTDFLAAGYFFERQINEYRNKLILEKTVAYEKSKVLKLEKVFKVIFGYYINEFAGLSKRSISEMFRHAQKDMVLDRLNVPDVIEAINWYDQIVSMILDYSDDVKNNTSKFFERLGIAFDPDRSYEDYMFLKTGDILILNAIGNLRGKVADDMKMPIAIDICKVTILESGLPYYNATKYDDVFKMVQEKIATFEK